MINPCKTLKNLTGNLGHYLMTFLTKEKYDLLLELCENLPHRDEFEKIYRQFKRRSGVNNPLHPH